MVRICNKSEMREVARRCKAMRLVSFGPSVFESETNEVEMKNRRKRKERFDHVHRRSVSIETLSIGSREEANAQRKSLQSLMRPLYGSECTFAFTCNTVAGQWHGIQHPRDRVYCCKGARARNVLRRPCIRSGMGRICDRTDYTRNSRRFLASSSKTK